MKVPVVHALRPGDPGAPPRKAGTAASADRASDTTPLFAGVPTLDPWTYVTTEQLARDTAALASRLPPDLDLVVAVARSGLLPGSLVAALRHLPLRCVSRQRGITDPGHGGRMEGHALVDPADPKHVLLIDDTVAHGREMAANLRTVRAAWPDARVTRAAVYGRPEGLASVDQIAAVYPGMHYLEWNWCNAGHGQSCGYDFDGILCRDDDGTRPLHLPRRAPIPLIVTGRHESAREFTQAWLDRFGVKAERLVMRAFDAPDVFDARKIARLKARHYRESDCQLFAESDPGQAQLIADGSGKPVLCPEAGRVLLPSDRSAELRAREQFHRRVKACPHFTRDCGCEWGKCALGKSGYRELNADDCRECLRGDDGH